MEFFFLAVESSSYLTDCPGIIVVNECFHLFLFFFFRFYVQKSAMRDSVPFAVIFPIHRMSLWRAWLSKMRNSDAREWKLAVRHWSRKILLIQILRLKSRFFQKRNLSTDFQARMKQYIVVGIVGSLFGFAICGAVVLMVKYLIDKHKDTSNFNAMRRQSRARWVFYSKFFYIKIQIDIRRDKGQKKTHISNDVLLRFDLATNLWRFDFHELSWFYIILMYSAIKFATQLTNYKLL